MLRRKNLLILLVSLLFLTVLIPTVCAVDNETAIVSDKTSDFTLLSISDGNDDILETAVDNCSQSVENEDNSLSVFEGELVSEPTKESSNINVIVPSEVRVGESAKISVDIVNATGKVSVLVDGRETNVNLVNGNAVVELNNMSVGNHSVVVIYNGDDFHTPAHRISSFSVVNNVIKPVVTEFVNITVFNDSKVSAILVDNEGKGIVDAKINYNTGSNSGSVVTDSKGLFTVRGENGVVMTLTFAGDNAYLATNTTIMFDNVAPAVRQSTVIVGNNYTQYAVDYSAGERGQNFTVKLTDAKGNVLANKVVLIGYNGKTLYRTTDDKGYAGVQINLRDENRLTFAVTFLGDDKYDASMSVYLITINKKPVTITAAAKKFKASAKTKKYSVTLKTIKGDSVDGKTYFGAGKKVTLNVNGKIYSGKVDSNGKVTFALKLTKKGKYTATINYAGDTTYKAASKKVKIRIN